MLKVPIEDWKVAFFDEREGAGKINFLDFNFDFEKNE